MTDEPTADVVMDQPRPWFAFFLRPGFLLAVAPFLILAIVALTYRSTRFAGIPPIEEIVDRETEGRIDIKPEENAFTYYERAWKQLPATLDDDAIGDAVAALNVSGDWSDVTPSAKRALASCEALLAVWKRGTECERGVRVQPADAEWYDLIGVQDSRTLVRLAILMSARCRHEGDVDEAWQWHRALFRFSRHLGNPGPWADRWTGVVFHTMCRNSLVYWAADDRVTASQLKTAQRDLTAIYQMTAPNSLVLKFGYLTTSRLLSHPSPVQESYVFEEAVPEELKSVSGIYLFLNAEPQLADLVLRHVFANYFSQSDLPRRDRAMAATRYTLYAPTGTENPPLMNVKVLDDALARSKLAGNLRPRLDYVLAWTDREQAIQTALELCLTVELFRRKRGRYPETLEELVPEFIAEIPRDLYGTTPEERMLMTRQTVSDVDDEPEEKDYYSRPGLVIYCRGENGIDDGGEIRLLADIGLKIPLEPIGAWEE